jgi:uncharacterized membrane protein
VIFVLLAALMALLGVTDDQQTVDDQEPLLSTATPKTLTLLVLEKILVVRTTAYGPTLRGSGAWLGWNASQHFNP